MDIETHYRCTNDYLINSWHKKDVFSPLNKGAYGSLICSYTTGLVQFKGLASPFPLRH